MTTAKDITEAMREGRVCPKPHAWNRRWELLPNRTQKGAGWKPALSLNLDAWHRSSNAAKPERFHLHLRWAEQHCALDSVTTLLAILTARDWLLEPEDLHFDF